MDGRKKLTEEEAKEACTTFLMERHHVERYHGASYRGAKVDFSQVRLVTEDGVPSYYLEGKLEVRSGTIVAQFLFPSDRYTFRMWVSASAGKILRWEMH